MKKLDSSEIKTILLDILIDLQRVCDKNGLKMFLVHGTLLGAVRHKGFIPWDDDIDVGMLRDDYEKLIDIYNKQKGKSYYRLCSLDNDEAWIPYAKVVDLRTRTDYSNGYRPDSGDVWVDIFPVDGYPDSPFKQRWHSLIAHMYSSQIAMGNSTWENFRGIDKVAVVCFRKFGIKRICQLAVKHAKKYRVSDYKLANSVVWGGGKGEETGNEDYMGQEPVEFEGYRFYAMRNYRKYLERRYGEDYMEIPPAEKIRNHHFDAWIDESYSNR